MTILKRLILIAAVAIFAIGIGFVVWAKPGFGPGSAADAVMETAAEPGGSAQERFVMRPQGEAVTGFIFYTGAKVNPESYAPVLAKVAEAGFLVSAADMPLNLAVLAPNRAEALMALHPEITRWGILGHSLGGVSAAGFALSDEAQIDGVAFWASYPAPKADLRAFEGPVASISASLDGLSSPEEVEASHAQLPEDTVYTVIAGGNHAQFGDYGAQSGDNAAEISPEDQWQQVADATIDWLSRLKN